MRAAGQYEPPVQSTMSTTHPADHLVGLGKGAAVTTSTGGLLKVGQQLHDIGTILPAAMWTDRRDEPASFLGGHVPVASVITEQSWRRDDPRTLECGMHEGEIRAAELIGEKSVDAERVRKHIPSVSPSSRPNVGRESDVSSRL